MWRSISSLPGAKQLLSSLRCIQSSGDTLLRMDHDLVRAVLADDCKFLSVYGATEAPALIQWFVTNPPADEVRVPAGYPLPDIELAVVDELGRPTEDGEPGELVIRSRFTSLGVWQRGKVLPGALLAGEGADNLKVYRTGDLVRRRLDGLYVVLGRRDRQIKVLGNRVELAEIEMALRQAPGVLDGAVVAQRGNDEPTVLAFFVPRDSGDSLLAGRVRRHLDETLPAFMRPRRLLALDSLPLLPGRKIDENALLAKVEAAPEPRTARAEGNEHRPASSEARTMVDRAWRAALGRPPPQVGLSFEAAGGDSLQLLQLVFELERQARRPLPIERFHGGLTSSDFARQLDGCLAGSIDVLPDDAPSIFLFPPAGGGDAYLTSFRAACATRMPVRQVRYPDLREMALPQSCFEDVAASAVRQINGWKPGGPLVLAGYSDGGDVAWEAARQLHAAGRQVARLLILDTDTSGLSYPSPAAGRKAPQPRLARLVRVVRTLTLARLTESLLPGRIFRTHYGRWFVRLSLTVRLPLPESVVFVASLRAFQVLFNEQHLRWLANLRPVPLDTQTVLFRSQEHRPGAPADLGWSARATALEVVPVPGDHSTMLEGDRGREIAARFAELASRA